MSFFFESARREPHDSRLDLARVVKSQSSTPRRWGELVVIRGAGDIASGVAIRLMHCGYRVVMLEIDQPTAIRRSAAFAQAVFDGSVTVEGLPARLAATAQEALDLTLRREIALLVDPQAASLGALAPDYLV
jgi:xanthine dehydrogenase accessory factor